MVVTKQYLRDKYDLSRRQCIMVMNEMESRGIQDLPKALKVLDRDPFDSSPRSGVLDRR